MCSLIIISHMSLIISHMSLIISHMPLIVSHMSLIISHMSLITLHTHLQHSLEDIVAVPVTDVSFVLLTQLVAVADVSLTFDPSLPVLCWKSIGKVLCKSKPHLLSHDWSVQPIVSQLCVAIETKCKECVGNSSLSVDEVCRHLHINYTVYIVSNCEAGNITEEGVYWDSPPLKIGNIK